jgi:hypothetical protein
MPRGKKNQKAEEASVSSEENENTNEEGVVEREEEENENTNEENYDNRKPRVNKASYFDHSEYLREEKDISDILRELIANSRAQGQFKINELARSIINAYHGQGEYPTLPWNVGKVQGFGGQSRGGYNPRGRGGGYNARGAPRGRTGGPPRGRGFTSRGGRGRGGY